MLLPTCMLNAVTVWCIFP